MSTTLQELGWSNHWQKLFDGDSTTEPARIIRGDRGMLWVATAHGTVRAKPSIAFIKEHKKSEMNPAVGDWVAIAPSDEPEMYIFEKVLPRKSVMLRGNAGKSSANQALAANIDIVFVVHPIADGLNLRRIERELSIAWQSGAQPVILLTKADLATDPEELRQQVKKTAPGIEVHAVNSKEMATHDLLCSYIKNHVTAVLLGPSGAGKSTLVNTAVQLHQQETGAVREGDGKGRHTTVAREIVIVPGQGVIIDTPGIRAIALTSSTFGINKTFPEIEQAAQFCRFHDCRHEGEAGCAVAEAIDAGEVCEKRFENYQKMHAEAEEAAARIAEQAKIIAKNRPRPRPQVKKKR